jgi:hypothetical protein
MRRLAGSVGLTEIEATALTAAAANAVTELASL